MSGKVLSPAQLLCILAIILGLLVASPLLDFRDQAETQPRMTELLAREGETEKRLCALEAMIFKQSTESHDTTDFHDSVTMLQTRIGNEAIQKSMYDETNKRAPARSEVEKREKNVNASQEVQPSQSKRCLSASSLSDIKLDAAAMSRATNVQGDLRLWHRISEKICNKVASPLKLLLLGGSVQSYPWVASLCEWLKNAIPDSECYNGGKGFIGSMAVFRDMNHSAAANLDIHDMRPDIILVETTVDPWHIYHDGSKLFPMNMTYEAHYVEKIVRQDLQYDWNPLLVAWDWLILTDHLSAPPNFITNQDMHTHVYKYYGIPAVSVREVLWPHLSGNTRHFTPGSHFNEVQLTPSMSPALPITDIWLDGMHPSVFGGNIIVDVITGFLSAGIQLAYENLHQGQGNVEMPSELPPMLMTDDEQQFMFPDANGHGGSDVTNNTQIDEYHEHHGTIGSSANITARATDILTLLSGCSLLASEWVQVGLSSGEGPGLSTLQQPSDMPMVGLALIRVVSHVHIACMHYFQLQPENMAVFIGFPSWAQWGWCWVQFFFVLSGFVLYLAYAGNVDEWSWAQYKTFLLKRVSTLYPVFALALVIAYMNPASQELARQSPGQLVSTILLVQSWMRPYGEPLLDGPSWYLCSLLAFYLLFPRWLRHVQRCAQPAILLCILWVYSWLLSISIASLSMLTGRPAEEDLDAGLMAFLDFHPACNWHLFLFGMVLARCCGSWSDQIASWKSQLLIACPVLLLGMLFTTMQCPQFVLRVFFNKGAFLLPVFSCLLIGFASPGSKWLRTWSAQDKAIQGCAWCLYILHVPLFYILRGVFADHGVINPLVLVGVAIVVSAVVHRFYDQPVQQRLKMWRE